MNISELFSLKGRTALVTGGARNLGHDMAEALAEAGADVAITSRDPDSAANAAAALNMTTGRRILAVEMDVRDEDSVKAGVDRVLSEFGRLDILVNNAGNVKNSAPLESRKREDWDETFATNVSGVFFCCKYAVPYMVKAKKGSIVIIASIAGMAGKDRRHYLGSNLVGVTLDYSASKGAALAMMRDLAAYVAPHGIRVNAISPGGFERGQPKEFIRRYNESTMLGRMGQPGELKGAVVYLASDASAYVTGHNLVVDGGLTAW
ncbi:MAG: SDR family oxidoreductase [Lentisphaerae bacterium]|nr:SDR family oxidoreductase [Lentisphaerota bacterium]